MLLSSFFLCFFTVVVTAQSSCVSLASSITCSAFSQFYISLPGLATDYPFLINTTTIEEFDTKLLNYVNSTSAYLFPLGCLSSNFNPTIPYARYSITKLCAAMIQNTDYSLPCNFQNELIPPPLCQNTCFEWLQSVTQITNNSRVCSDSIQRNNTLQSFQDQCYTWEGFNGTVTENCISGIANEPYTCGFGANNFRVACHYCKNNPQDGCCQNVESCHHPLSKGAVAGIVLGSVSFIAIILLIIYWTCHKRKNPNVNPFQFMSASAAASSATQPELKPQVPLELQPTISTPTIITSPSPSSLSSVVVNHEFYVVIHPYTSQIPDELQLSPGDIICLALHFDDGWALGFNVTTGLKGAFPLVCISLAPADSLDQLLNMQSDPIQRTLSVQQQQQQQNNKPTINTNFRHSIPKRSVSCKSKYDYIEPESPSSPTLHTPFFKHTI